MSFDPSSTLSYPAPASSPAAYASYYRDLHVELHGLLHGERDMIANLANSAALLSMRLPELNWCGFYLWREEQLIVGPFVGKPACVRIQLGRGVCGTCAAQRSPVLVPDVTAFPGHIACDANSASELVVPLQLGECFLGLIDLDSPRKGRFSLADQQGMLGIADLIADSIDWPAIKI
jgi:GAF domain-containing protein